MRKSWKLAAVTGVAVAVGMMTGVGSAFATPPTGYGFDNTSHVIVGGGSDTTYRAQVGISDLWSESSLSGCPHITANGATANNCNSTGSPETDTNLGNYQGDTISQANPIGSGAGISSLNGNAGAGSVYNGTVNNVPSGTCITATTGPNVDFARSSRAPKTTSGSAPCGNELTADTFWGYAQDGVEVSAFNSRGAQLQGAGGSTLTAQQLFNIWNCSGGTGTAGHMRWSDVIPSITPGGAGDADIVPWQMNTSSGTFATFQTYITNNATGVPTGWSPDAQACDRKLTSGNVPLENDIKPLVNDSAPLSTSSTDFHNPANWLWWGSFGVFSAFPYTSSYTLSGTSVTAIAAPINGILPSTSRIIANTYPIGRTLYHVTRKADADCVKTGGACDFPGHPGPAIGASGNDLNVTGATGGTAGAVREYTRFICRGSATQQGPDPFTGTSYFSEITTAINNAGFTVVPTALRTSGSRCQVLS